MFQKAVRVALLPVTAPLTASLSLLRFLGSMSLVFSVFVAMSLGREMFYVFLLLSILAYLSHWRCVSYNHRAPWQLKAILALCFLVVIMGHPKHRSVGWNRQETE